MLPSLFLLILFKDVYFCVLLKYTKSVAITRTKKELVRMYERESVFEGEKVVIRQDNLTGKFVVVWVNGSKSEVVRGGFKDAKGAISWAESRFLLK